MTFCVMDCYNKLRIEQILNNVRRIIAGKAPKNIKKYE